MRVFVSQPMDGVAQSVIQCRNNDAECWLRAYFGENVETVNGYTAQECPAKITGPQRGFWYMSYSLNKMAECDAILMWGEWHQARGCKLEMRVAQEYGLPIIMKRVPDGKF